MGRLSKLKRRAAQIANRDDDNLGPDRGTRDQQKARIKRAKQEARREAKQQKVKERAEQARDQERERVLNDEEGGIVSSIATAVETAAENVDTDGTVGANDLSEAFGTDFDDDGEPFAEEIGLQSAQRGRREDQMLQGLSQQVDRNSGRIDGLEEEDFGLGSEPIEPEAFGFGGSSDDDLFGGTQ
jgi:hypothetical protein